LPFSRSHFVSLYIYMHPFLLAQPQLCPDSPYPYISIKLAHLPTYLPTYLPTSLQGIISHKTFNFIVTAVRTSLISTIFVHNFNLKQWIHHVTATFETK
jgi:hypothetical protein